MEQKLRYKFWLVVFALVFIALMVYLPHFNYKFPLHTDEYHHIGSAKKLISGEYNFNLNSVFEIGYHLFLAGLIKAGLNILNYKFLVVIFALFSALMLFNLVYYLTKNFWASWFSLLFFGLLPSNSNLLGIWFATPLSFAIGFMFLSLFLFIKGFNEKNKKYIIFSGVLLVLLSLVHAISAIFVYLVIFVFCFYSWFKQKERLKYNLLSIIILFLMFLIPVLFFVLISGKNLSWFFLNVIFKQGWTPLEPGVYDNALEIWFLGYRLLISPFFLPVLCSGIFFLALFGLYYVFKNKNIGLKIFLIWFFLSISLVFLFVNFKFSIFIPYQRAVYYSLLSLVGLAGIGASWLKNKGWIGVFFLFLFFILLLFNLTPTKGMEIYHLIDEDDFQAMSFLQNLEQGKIISLPRYGEAISAISGKENFVGHYFSGEKNREASIRFFSADCSKKQEILEKNNIDYVYSKEKIGCDYLEELYSLNNIYIYKFEK